MHTGGGGGGGGVLEGGETRELAHKNAITDKIAKKEQIF
jgi:hypothetical protein